MKKTQLKRGTSQLKRSGFKNKTIVKKKKSKKPTRAKLKKKLWKVFTKCIKARDKYICFTCGKFVRGQGMGGGHYKPRAACGLEYYFSEINVNAQCTYCNLTLQGDQVNYRARLVKKYGEKKILEIDLNYHKPTYDYPFEEKIEHYQTLLKDYE